MSLLILLDYLFVLTFEYLLGSSRNKLRTFLFLLMNQQRNFLVTIGEEDQVAPQQSALCLKVFDLDKIQPEGSSTTNPECVGIMRIFTNQFPEAKVMALLCLLVTHTS